MAQVEANTARRDADSLLVRMLERGGGTWGRREIRHQRAFWSIAFLSCRRDILTHPRLANAIWPLS